MRRAAILATLGLIVLLLVLAQLLLPGIAAQQLRDRLAASGTVLHVEVDAFPALELLWHRADKVVVRMAQYRSSTGHLSSLLDQAANAGSLDASALTLQAGLLTLHDASLRKRGRELTGSARVVESDLRTAIPILQNVQPVASGAGTLTLRGTASLLGIGATIDATVGAQNGRLVVQPNIPFGGFATLTLFEDPHVVLEGVSATSAPGGFGVSAQARLR